jgi:serine/threonine protein phosphatase PrpC
MSTHSFISKKSGRMSRLAFSIFSNLLFALPLVLLSFSPALASSARRLADQPQDLARSGVSVVRLIVSYSTGKPTAIVQCTGLGVLVAGWPFQSGTNQNNWVLTDGNLINPGKEATCASSHPVARLATVEVFLSAAYNPEALPLNFTASPNMVHCLKSCTDGPALFAFNTSMTLPFIDPGIAAPTQEIGIGLTKNPSSSSLPIAANINTQLAGQFSQQAQQFLTPNRLPLNGAMEPGTPIVNALGELTGLHLSGSNKPASLKDITALMQKQPELKPPLIRNVVHDNWDTGITDFYQQNLPAAHAAFQSAATANPQFQGAQSFAQRTLVASTGGSENARSPSTGTSSGLTFLGISLPLVLSILGLIVLVVLLILTSLKFGRARARRRALKVEYAEAERQATLEAQRIKEMEAAQQRTWAQPATSAQSAPQGGLRTSPLPDLRCPRCGTFVPQGASFCSNCRLQLSPTESGKHLAVSPPAPAPVASSRALAEQPTIEMSPSMRANGQADGDKTIPYSARQLQGQRLGLAVSARTDRGIKRKHKPNEDSLFAAQGMLSPDAPPQQFGLFVIADGMGGHANGQDASRRAIQTIIDFMLPRIMKQSDWQDEALAGLLVESVQQANQAVHQNNMELRADMGTTVTAALVVDATAYVTNVGDSRTYLYRVQDGLKKITHDHSVVASLVEAGIIKPDDIYTHPKRNQIYRSLGEKPLVEVDSFVVHLQPDDKLLLCSDGLWDMVRDPKIEDVIKSHIPDLEATADALIQAALDGGGEDNVSIIVVSMAEVAQQPLTPGIQVLAKPETVQMPDW